MKKYIIIFIIVAFIALISACASKKDKIDDKLEENKVTSLTSSLQSNSKNEIKLVEEEIQEVSGKIEEVKIVFASSGLENASLDTVIVTLSTKDSYKVSDSEEKSIKKLINNSMIKEIISYKKVEIQYY